MHLLLSLLVALVAVGACVASRGTMPDKLDRAFLEQESIRHLARNLALQDELAAATKDPIVKEVLEGLADAIAVLNESFQFPTFKHFEVYRLLAQDDRRLRTLINTIRGMHAMSPLDPCLCEDVWTPTGGCHTEIYWALRYDFPCSPSLCACSRMRVALYVSETPLAPCGGKPSH